jgi:hypothetical protein
MLKMAVQGDDGSVGIYHNQKEGRIGDLVYCTVSTVDLQVGSVHGNVGIGGFASANAV